MKQRSSIFFRVGILIVLPSILGMGFLILWAFQLKSVADQRYIEIQEIGLQHELDKAIMKNLPGPVVQKMVNEWPYMGDFGKAQIFFNDSLNSKYNPELPLEDQDELLFLSLWDYPEHEDEIIRKEDGTVYTLHYQSSGTFYNGYILLYTKKINLESNVNQEGFWYQIFVMILLFFSPLILVYISLKFITKPLHRLITASQKVADGDLTQEVKIKGKHEVSLLSYYFNSMVKNLRENVQRLNDQKEEIETQRDRIEAQKRTVEEAHYEVKESINYAKRIQSAIIPSKERLDSLLPTHFVYDQPKDIVSGDFYWLEETDDSIYFAVADCTGHGVPGAMVSVICNNALNKAVREFSITTPGEVLAKARELILETFDQSSCQMMDGMDISMVKISKKDSNIQWAGANNPLYIVRSNSQDSKEVEIIKANRQPVGYADEINSFTNHTIKVESGDMLYLFSDGFPDQFGGPAGKKLGYKSFRSILTDVAHREMKDQHQILENYLDIWMEYEDQIDDVCVVGIRF